MKNSKNTANGSIQPLNKRIRVKEIFLNYCENSGEPDYWEKRLSPKDIRYILAPEHRKTPK